MEKAGIFYGHLAFFTVIWFIYWPFGNVVVIWYIFLCFVLFFCAKKNLATLFFRPNYGYRLIICFIN
jgi:hypothetical protein